MVAGGQITTTARGASPAVIRLANCWSSLSAAREPFIFQLPAISGVIVVVTLGTPASCTGTGFALTPIIHALRETKGLLFFSERFTSIQPPRR
jgi:hypothetical protein